MIRSLIFLMLMASPVAAESVIAALSQNRVRITTTFHGSQILVFGAIQHGVPLDQAEDLDVVITVSGPAETITVRRKEKVAGIWVNTDAVEVDAAPSFYAISTTRPISQVLSDSDDLRHKITIPRAIRSVGAPQTIMDSGSFTDAVIRIRENKGLYQQLEGQTTIFDKTLFRTDIALPANLVEGAYKTRIFLTKNKQVVSEYQTFINVRKVGLERWIFNLAHQRPLIYGLLSLTIAIISGWLASAVFRYLRG